jgi:hypothetical protein
MDLAQKACADEKYGLGYLGVYAWAKFAATSQLQALAQKGFDGCPSETLLTQLKTYYAQRGSRSAVGSSSASEAETHDRIEEQISMIWATAYPEIRRLCFDQSTDRFMAQMQIKDRKLAVDNILLKHLKPKIIQAVYFVDGTNSAYRQRNLLHQMSRWVKPRRDFGNTGYVRILSGISVFNGDGIQDLHGLAAGQIMSDITDLGVNEIYIIGFSRGSIMSLGLTRDLCGVGNDLWAWSESSLKSGDIKKRQISKAVLSELAVCSKIKAVVLIDPVDTNLFGWSKVIPTQLKANTIKIYKKNTSEHVVTTARLENIEHWVEIADLNHTGMMCGNLGPGGAQASNLPLVLNTAADFLRQRGLLMVQSGALQDCRNLPGAWPPCIVVDGRRTACGRNESDQNWQLDEW